MTIQKFQICRQFLFKKKDVGKSNSIIAVESIKEMNPNFNGE